MRGVPFAIIALLTVPTQAFPDFFSNYPAEDAMSEGELISLPDFNGRDAAYQNFRTRITNGLKEGPNFSGHYAMIEIGCGTFCRFAFLADARTGEVFEFPYGGEENYEMTLTFSSESKVVRVKWADLGADQCIEREILWTGQAFDTLHETRTQRANYCNP